jgi:hypothetical protein
MKITNYSILWPVFALVFWTLCILALMGVMRLRAGLRGQVKARDLKAGATHFVPKRVRLPNRNYMNLLEAPVLFYVVCLVIYVTALPGSIAIVLAWLYVAIRVAHSLIHVTYNKVMHRLAVFVLSNFILIAMWGLTLWTMLKPSSYLME